MSNGTNTPFGFSAIRTLDGSDCNGMASGMVCTIASAYDTNLIPGDPVTFSGTGSASGPGIVRATAGAAIIGIFGGLTQQIVTTSPGSILFQQVPSFVADTTSTSEIIAWVYTNPFIIYAVQTGATGLAATDLGSNAQFVIAEGNLTTNLSGVVITCPGATANPTYNCKIIGLADAYIYPGNDFGNTYNVAEVLINNHVFKGGTGTAGI